MKKRTSFILILLSFFMLHSIAQNPSVSIKIEHPATKLPIQQNMFGIFFEDINFAADGGLYAELVKNRSFEFINSPLMGWLSYGWVEVKNSGGPFERNPHFVRLTNNNLLSGTGIINEGFRGIGLKKEAKYKLSFYARNIDSPEGKLKIELISDQADILFKTEITVQSGDWKKYSAELVPAEGNSHAKLRIDLLTSGSIDLEHVSLFPADTYKGRENGMRNDLATALEELNPGVFRFPGGCIIEGNSLETRYQWKNSVGPVENRPINENRWNYVFQHRFTPDYFQSYGLGFFEYFQLCEDIGADPLPVVNCGMACQFIGEEKVQDEDLLPYIQDALDLIEFANGPVTSTWGKVRAEMGHSEPFGLKLIAIGNEQWGEHYPPHLEEFMKAIHKKYPEVKIIGSSGPYPDGKEFDYLWGEMKRLNVDLVDEHYYRDPKWFLAQADRYDKYDRNGPKVFAGEYACHDHPEKKNSFYSALCEAALMTGIERNSDVVHLATYAPLFAHVDAWQWKPDMIWYDNVRSVRSANYYVQQLFATNMGTQVLKATANGETLTGKNDLYVSSVLNENKNQLIVKLAYVGKNAKPVEISFADISKGKTVPCSHILLKAPLTAENTLDDPSQIIPERKTAKVEQSKMTINVEPESFNVFVIDLK